MAIKKKQAKSIVIKLFLFIRSILIKLKYLKINSLGILDGIIMYLSKPNLEGKKEKVKPLYYKHIYVFFFFFQINSSTLLYLQRDAAQFFFSISW